MLTAKRVRTYIEEGGPGVPESLLPGVHYLRYRVGRVSAAREERDKGALSIELALLVIVLIAAAAMVVLAIKSLVTTESGKIKDPGN
ncbi:hypothetical protein [Streptacidiphilus carbonis]|jgi:hypothetical protein|uniref:hypothetical protein n=1 Tax=Streptacidiphilus carbonis TaxID=105422 RepID=UPI0005A80492|nr:hypothetical protein [Streptacidiphilus carbonis]